ncbi:probable palmitoyltransferase ZDHHC24 [Drosophila gunungcola]|uniref:probable palmitoyltransferase ZDHHC24 n=1 Tax=Drosophila gunungcola TaxID=103775 RepID=UPI0022E461A7|nr:probable palmitoyltransferase ZDHHC24 [Drosophila gunungcola]
MCYVNSVCKYYANRYPEKFVKTVHPLSVIFVLVGIVFFFSVQMFYIAPKVYGDLAYKFYWILAIFITYNVLGNMLVCYSTNTSVSSLPKERQVPDPEEEHLWHYCEICQKLMPPRSWHCVLCQACILKRDHHCIFTATCIGHNNQRYFFWLTFYLTFGLVVSFATLSIYACKIGLRNFMFSPVELLVKIAYKDHGCSSRSIFENLALNLNIITCLIPGFMLAYQIQILYLNSSYYEMFTRIYDLGVRENCKIVMGQRGLWTFVSPSLKSPLPNDGTQWQMKQKL